VIIYKSGLMEEEMLETVYFKCPTLIPFKITQNTAMASISYRHDCQVAVKGVLFQLILQFLLLLTKNT
jgi:hypothetical protein